MRVDDRRDKQVRHCWLLCLFADSWLVTKLLKRTSVPRPVRSSVTFLLRMARFLALFQMVGSLTKQNKDFGFWGPSTFFLCISIKYLIYVVSG